MYCHKSRSRNWKLLGVFKETYGLVDWAEQLFKHQGYCLWDEDDYNLMQKYYSKLTTYCTQLCYGDDYGNDLYINTKTTGGVNVTFGVYLDKDYLIDSGLDISDYIYIYYKNYYGNGSKGEDVVSY